MAQKGPAKLDRLLAKLPPLADILRGSLLHRSTFHSHGCSKCASGPRPSTVGPQRQLSWRQEPSDQFAPRPVASGATVAPKLPPGKEGPGVDLPAQPALLARPLLAAPHHP